MSWCVWGTLLLLPKAEWVDSCYVAPTSCGSELAYTPNEEVSGSVCSSTSPASSIICYGPLPDSGLALNFAPAPSLAHASTCALVCTD